jgi:cytochrome c-type biogenesis protein CcmH/NrfF
MGAIETMDGISPGRARSTDVLALLIAAVLLCATLAPLARTQQTDRAKALGKRMLCMCGCGQILTECNHVGCTMSAQMLKELDEQVARNESDDLTVQSFIQEYGLAVMAQPATKGFGLIAWVLPVVVVVFGLWLVSVVVERWRKRAATLAPAAAVSPEMLARARRETDKEE